MSQPEWQVVGVSACGSSHEAGKLPCQDAHAHRIVDHRWVVIAVADGAGSVTLADVGARVAVDHAVHTLTDRVRALTADQRVMGETEWRDVLYDVLRSTREAIQRESDCRKQPVKELSSTLLVMLLGPSLTTAVQIGDGAIVVLSGDGAIEALTRPEPSEHINETVFLTTLNAVKTAQFAYRATTVKSAAVLTDGLQLLALTYPDWQPFSAFFQPVFEFFAAQTDTDRARVALERMLSSGDVRNRTNDDLTLMVVTRANVPAAAPALPAERSVA